MSARDRAEACFALARSTTFPGERENAIASGTRIAQAAGLDLDLFDIPGRKRARGRAMILDVEVDLNAAGWGLSINELAELLDRIYDELRPVAPRPPRYCPHGSDLALFGESCVMCERERRFRAT